MKNSVAGWLIINPKLLAPSHFFSYLKTIVIFTIWVYNLGVKNLWLSIKNHRYNWLVVIVFLILVTAIVTMLYVVPNLSVALVAIGTLLLALVTWLHIESDRQHRKYQEEREFKKCCMDDIYKWARDGIAALAEFPPSRDSGRQRDIFIHLAPLRAVNNWMMNASRQFDEKKLVRSVDKAAEELKQYVAKLQEQALGTDKEHEQCRVSFNKVIEYIADLKVKLQL